MKFSSEQQLQEFLGLLDSDYRKYAAALWGYGVTSANQLSTGSVDTLIAAGISNRLHAENIKSLCGRAGGVTGGAAEAADRSLVSSESFQQGMSSLRAALSEQRKQLLEEQQKALEAQKREILESLGKGKVKAH